MGYSRGYANSSLIGTLFTFNTQALQRGIRDNVIGDLRQLVAVCHMRNGRYKLAKKKIYVYAVRSDIKERGGATNLTDFTIS